MRAEFSYPHMQRRIITFRQAYVNWITSRSDIMSLGDVSIRGQTTAYPMLTQSEGAADSQDGDVHSKYQ